MYDIYVNVNIYNVTLNVSNTDVNDMPNMHTKCNMLKKKIQNSVTFGYHLFGKAIVPLHNYPFAFPRPVFLR